MADEGTTTLDSLDATLSELMKATGATKPVDPLRKGDGLKMEGGVGNDFATTGDAGSLDDMMIGKAKELGFDDEQAKAMVGLMGAMINHTRPSPTGKGKKGKMRGKAEGEEDPDETELDETDPDDEGEGFQGKAEGGFPFPPKKEGEGAPMAKSHAERFREDQDIRDAMDVSPFLEAIAAKTAQSLDVIHKSMLAKHKKDDTISKAMANALVGLGTIVKSQNAVIAALGERLGIVERTPLQPKGATGNAKPLIKKGFGDQPVELRKSQIVSALSYMNLERNIKTIGSTRTVDLITKAEAGNLLEKSTLDVVHTFLKTNPHEAERALTYQ